MPNLLSQSVKLRSILLTQRSVTIQKNKEAFCFPKILDILPLTLYIC